MKRANWPVVAIAIVWALVILGTAVMLRGAPYWASMLPIVGGSSAVGILFLPPSIAAKRTSLAAIAGALVWGTVLLSSALVLWGTPYLVRTLLLEGAGTAASFIILALAHRQEAKR